MIVATIRHRGWCSRLYESKSNAAREGLGQRADVGFANRGEVVAGDGVNFQAVESKVFPLSFWTLAGKRVFSFKKRHSATQRLRGVVHHRAYVCFEDLIEPRNL